jgi:hypothetical protein
VVSASDIWAVGFPRSGTHVRPLMLHWNGTSWQTVASHSPVPPGDGAELTGVAATSASNAWATGNVFTQTLDRSFILHWNGTTWAPVKTLAASDLSGIGASSASNAWAVGSLGGGDFGGQTLTLHWDGHTWAHVKSPDPATDPGFGQTLSGVVVTSASNALAAGQFGISGGEQTLILRWDGHTWQQVPSSNPGVLNHLFAISASSASNAWAVGTVDPFPATSPPHGQPIALHCC